MASLEILLISVRSETPTSFFLVVSKTALVANWAFCCPGRAAPPAAAASFLRPARLDTAPYTSPRQRLHSGGGGRGRGLPWLMPDRELRSARWSPDLACRVCCCTQIAAESGGVWGRWGSAGAMCGERRSGLERKRVVSKISGLRSVRLSNPTNDVTAHAGRIGSRCEYGSPHSHSLLRAVTQVTRKLFRRPTSSTAYIIRPRIPSARTAVLITRLIQAATKGHQAAERVALMADFD